MTQFIRTIKAYNEESELNILRNSGTLVFKVSLDFNSPQSAVKFRQNLPDIEDVNWHFNSDDRIRLSLYSSSSFDELVEEYKNSYMKEQKISPLETHLEFRVYKDFGGDKEKDYSNVDKKFKDEITNIFKHYTPNVRVALIPPSMKTFDYKDQDFIDMRDRIDTLFETLNAEEIRRYDFVIVGKDKAEAKAIQQQYLSYMSEYGRFGRYETPQRKFDKNVHEYTSKYFLKEMDWYKPNDLTYIKTVSESLDNGIYCLSVRARKYFRDWDNNAKTLIPIFDAKASQLSGKIVIAKKIK